MHRYEKMKDHELEAPTEPMEAAGKTTEVAQVEDVRMQKFKKLKFKVLCS